MVECQKKRLSRQMEAIPDNWRWFLLYCYLNVLFCYNQVTTVVSLRQIYAVESF